MLKRAQPTAGARVIYRTRTGRRRGNDQRKSFTETGYARLMDAAHQQPGRRRTSQNSSPSAG